MSERLLPPDHNSYQPPEGTPVRNVWWGEYSSANKLFPQNMRAIRIFSATGVLVSPPDDFFKLRNSHLTNDQVGEAAVKMNEAHDEFGIPKRTHRTEIGNSKKPTKSEKVELTRFEELWQSNADGVIRMILQRTLNGPPLPAREAINNGPIDMIPEEEVEKLNDYWHNPQKREEIEEIRESARLLRHIFNTDEGKRHIEDLSRIWLTTIVSGDLKKPLKRQILNSSRNYGVRTKMVDQLEKGIPYDETLDEMLSDPKVFGKKRTNKSADQDFVFLDLKEFIIRRIERFGKTMPFGLEYETDSKPSA